MKTNPWIAAHIAAETDYQGGNRSVAAQLVKMEFALGPDSMACVSCGGTTHWKATIGAMKCPDCGQLARSSGVLIGTPDRRR